MYDVQMSGMLKAVEKDFDDNADDDSEEGDDFDETTGDDDEW